MNEKKFELLVFDKIDSTNSFLKQQLAENPHLPFTFVAAKYQTQGRGQGKKIWSSEYDKNIIISFLYDSTKIAGKNNIFLLNKIVSLIIQSFIQKLLPAFNAYIKWPNDIIVMNKKIAGILIENFFQNNTIKSIIGIGININQDKFSEFKQKASSYKALTGKDLDIKETIKQFSEMTFNQLVKYEKTEIQKIETLYNSHLYRKNEIIHININNKKTEATLLSVDSTGRAVLQLSAANKIIEAEYGEYEVVFLS